MKPTKMERLAALRKTISEAKPRKLNYEFRFKDPLTHGWLLPCLIDADEFTWQRWAHWFRVMEAERLSDTPIPQIEFCTDFRGGCALKMLERCLDTISNGNGWRGWSSWAHFDFFLDWLLFGLGDATQKEEPKPRSDQHGASERLYQLFNLETLLAWPYDYFGDILADNAHGRHSGFFPTPMDVGEAMVSMTMGKEDMRAKTVCDPAAGTGRLLLSASNYSYRLYAVDIDGTVLKALRVNGYLYAPWLVRPLPFLATYESAHGDAPMLPTITARAPVSDRHGQLELITI